MKRLILILILLNLTLSAKSITIAIASNMSYVVDDLIKEFNKTNKNIKVKTILGSSGKLVAQIKNGAPYDIFMSANMEFPQYLYKNKLSDTKPTVYAKGALILFSNKELDFSKGLALLKDEKIKKIAIANPKTAPYGKAALEVLENSKIYTQVSNKLIFAESISQTVSYTITAANIGLITKSSLISPKLKNKKEGKYWINIDSKLYNPIDQGMTILKNREKDSEVKAFYNFILSKKAKEIFEKNGYLVYE